MPEPAGPSGENRLSAIIADRIRQNGPIGVDAFMAAALADPVHGYYITRDPLGRDGDFITAPEISQIFGEVIGAWCATLWQSLGKPKSLRLIELGPGRGTLMADILRAFRGLPEALDAISVHLIETSPILTAAQTAILARHHPKIAITWHEKIMAVPPGPALIIANEFFDALPIRQWIKRGQGWNERCVDISQDGDFTFVEGASGMPAVEPAGAGEGEIFETNEPALEIAQQLGERLCRDTGAVLIIDYGHLRSSCGETLQGVTKHRYASILDAPGSIDLTAHVDFDALARILRQSGLNVADQLTQGAFLLTLGGAIRAEILSTNKDPGKAAEIVSGFHRLVHPAGMGQLFKVLAAASADVKQLPGFTYSPVIGTAR